MSIGSSRRTSGTVIAVPLTRDRGPRKEDVPMQLRKIETSGPDLFGKASPAKRAAKTKRRRSAAGIRAAVDLVGPPTYGMLRLLAHWATRDRALKVSEDELLAEVRTNGADEWEQAIAEAESDLPEAKKAALRGQETDVFFVEARY